jgi:tetratricopeptide (TPR) repeat protein
MNHRSKVKKSLAAVLWLPALLTAAVSGPAVAREVTASPLEEQSIQARVEKAKVQAMIQIQQEVGDRSLLWYNPVGLVVLLTQSKNVPLTLQSLSLGGIEKEAMTRKFDPRETKALRADGVFRVLAREHLKSNLSGIVSVTAVDPNDEKKEPKVFSAPFTVAKNKLPLVILVNLTSVEGEEPGLETKLIPKTESALLGDLFSRHIKFLMDSENPLEAVVLLTMAQDESVQNRKEFEKWGLLLGRILVEWNLQDRARAVFQTMAGKSKVASNSAVAWFYLGKLYYNKGQIDKALDAFSRARADLPPALLPEILYLTGSGYINKSMNDKALQFLAMVPGKSSFYPFALYSSGLANLKENRPDAAKAEFQKLKSFAQSGGRLIRPLYDRALVSLGFYLVDHNKPQEALDVLGQLTPGGIYEDQIRFGIGWAYWNLNQCDKAAVTFGELVSKWPGSLYSEEARLKVGACYSKLGAYRKAVESYQEALRYYALQDDSLTNIVNDLSISPLNVWLANQREQFADPKKRNPLIRELAAQEHVQKAIVGYEALTAFSGQLDRVSSSLGGKTEVAAIKKRLEPLQSQVENEVKDVLAKRIEQIKKDIHERANQADIGMLRNFNLDR